MRSTRVFACIVFLSAALSAAQQSTFRAGVSLVTVDVTVIDKDGKPVPGLSAEDFEVKLGGKIQTVRALSFVEAATPSDVPPPKQAATGSGGSMVEPPKPVPITTAKDVEIRRTISNQDVAAPVSGGAAADKRAHQPEPRVFVILIDDLSFPMQGGKKLFAAAQKFVDAVPASDPVGFTTTSGSATVNPSMDRTAVKAGLAKVVGEFMDPRMIRKGNPEKGEKDQPIGMNEAIDIDRGDDSLLLDVIIRECFMGVRSAVVGRSVQQILSESNCASDIASESKRTAALVRQTKGRQLAAIASVVNAMRTATGIRHLVLITDGIAVQRDVIDLQPVTRAAAAAGIQFSVMMEDPDGISMEVNGRSTKQVDTSSQRIREDNKLMLNGAQTFTDVVGGIFYKVVGDAGPSFNRILESSSAVYRLGVELPAGAQIGKELSLGVSLKKPGLTVRANRMAINIAEPVSASANPAPPAPPVSIDDVLKTALYENKSLLGVPIRLGATIRRSTNVDGQVDLSVNVLFPSTVKTPITVLVGVVDSANALRINRRVVDSTVNPVQFLFPLAPGSYAVRLGAAAADGALGTIELPIAAKLHTMGALTTSDLIMFAVDETSQKAALFSLDEPPVETREKSTYHAAIELYPTGAMPSEPPVVNWTVVREGETKPIVEEDTEGRVGTKLFRADFEIPFASLPPGTYIVRATLLAADKPAGSVGAVIRKKW